MSLSLIVAYLSWKSLYLCSCETHSLRIHKFVGTPVTPALVWLYLVMYICGPGQLWVQAVIRNVLFQAVPRLLCPQGFCLFPLSSRGGPTCAAWPLCTPECLATSVHHLYMVCGGRGWPQARD